MKTSTNINRQKMLNTFYDFFIETNQSEEDINTNYSDLQNMNNPQLTKIYNSFFN